jgi:hypothetical protein
MKRAPTDIPKTMKTHEQKLKDGHTRMISSDTPAPVRKRLLALAKQLGAVVETEGSMTFIYLKDARDERIDERRRNASPGLRELFTILDCEED